MFGRRTRSTSTNATNRSPTSSSHEEPLRSNCTIPCPPDILLVTEVSDSTLRQDRRQKIPRYARSGIPEAWIVDVGRQRIHAFSEPAGITYQRETTYNRGEIIPSAAIPSLRLPVETAFD